MPADEKVDVEVTGIPEEKVENFKSRILEAIRSVVAAEHNAKPLGGVGFGLQFGLAPGPFG